MARSLHHQSHISAMTATPTAYPIVYLFRACAVESYVTGRPLLSALLLVYSVSNVLACTACGIYIFFVLHLFDVFSTVLNVISSLLAFSLFCTNFTITMHSICRRRQFAGMLLAVQRLDADGVRAEFDWHVRRRHMCSKYTVVMAVFALTITSTAFFYYSVIQSWRISFVVFISVVMRVRCLQIVFYVHQLHVRLLLLNAELRRGLAKLRNDDADAAASTSECGEWFNTLGRTYDGMWELCHMINDCFGWSFLALTSDASTASMVNCFLVFVQRFHRAAYGLLPTLVTFALVCWKCDECVQTVAFLDHYMSLRMYGCNAIESHQRHESHAHMYVCVCVLFLRT